MHTKQWKTRRIRKVMDLQCKFYTNGNVVLWKNINASLIESRIIFSLLTLLRQMRSAL